ncbi:hypothetical protein D3C72_1721180 [compost metagenome]
MSNHALPFAFNRLSGLNALSTRHSHQAVAPKRRTPVDHSERLEGLEGREAKLGAGHDRDHDLLRLVEAARSQT